MGDIEPITAEEARARLHAAVVAQLGDDWDDEQEGWTVVSRHDYMIRLTKGRRNIDFYVDLLGEITIEEKEINPGQDAGRTLAYIVIGGSCLLALIIARIAGYL